MIHLRINFVQLLLGFILLIGTISALKPEDCEGKLVNSVCVMPLCYFCIYCLLILFFFLSVCFKVVDKFSNSISDATRKDPKKIEDEFRKFCKGSKSKENRFVSCAI